MDYTKQLRTFIRGFLKKYSNLKRKNIESYTDDDAMKLFLCVFTHKSYSSRQNYEKMEFLGDRVINLCISDYIPYVLEKKINKRFNIDFATTLYNHLKSTGPFADIAEKVGFHEFIRVNEEHEKYEQLFINKIRLNSQIDPEDSDPPEINIEYRKILEDVLEAFCGAIAKIVNERTAMGVGYAVCYSFMKKILDEIIEKEGVEKYTQWSTVKMPITTLKEIWDGRHWSVQKKKMEIKFDKTKVRSKINGLEVTLFNNRGESFSGNGKNLNSSMIEAAKGLLSKYKQSAIRSVQIGDDEMGWKWVTLIYGDPNEKGTLNTLVGWSVRSEQKLAKKVAAKMAIDRLRNIHGLDIESNLNKQKFIEKNICN